MRVIITVRFACNTYLSVEASISSKLSSERIVSSSLSISASTLSSTTIDCLSDVNTPPEDLVSLVPDDTMSSEHLDSCMSEDADVCDWLLLVADGGEIILLALLASANSALMAG